MLTFIVLDKKKVKLKVAIVKGILHIYLWKTSTDTLGLSA